MKWASERSGRCEGWAVRRGRTAECSGVCVTRWRCGREWREVLFVSVCVYGTILSANNNNRRTDVSLIQHCITDTGRAESTQHAACSSTPGASSNSSSSSLPLLLHSCPLRLDQSFGQSITIVYLVKRAPLIAGTYHHLLPPCGLTRFLHGSRL